MPRKSISAFLCLISIYLVSAYAQKHVDVLYINSYHNGYFWSDGIQKGIETTLGQHENIRLHTEYLDTKRRPEVMEEPLFTEILERKYRNTAVEVIVVSDDNALIFIKRIRDRIFPGVPVVFCGINNLDIASLKDFDNVTGVNESADVKETVELMLKLHPGTERILAITDLSETGAPLSAQFKRVASEMEEKVEIIPVDTVSFSELLSTLDNAGPGTLVLYTFFFLDTEGSTFEYNEATYHIVKHCKVPLYSTFNVSPGIIGGKVTSAFLQGKTAARMALRIIGGEDPSDIPIQMHSPNKFIFDYPTLGRFGIPLKRLPPGSELLNRPPSIWETHLRFIILIAVALVLQAAAIILLIVSNRKRKRMETALRISERNYREIFNAVSEAILLHDLQGKILDYNDSALKMYGFTREQMDKATLGDLIGEDWPKVEDDTKKLEKAVTEGPQIFERLDRRNTDGKKFWVEVAIRSSQIGGKGRILAVVRDISERKRIESELRRNEQQLYQAQKLEAIGKLAGGIAHDFNNQLTGIMGFANLLGMEITDETQKKHIEDIVTICENAAELVKGLLTFARKGLFAAAPIDVHEVIESAANLLTHTLDKRIAIKADLEAAFHTIVGDHTQLQSALLNLAFNARDAMPRGGEIIFSTDNVRITDVSEHELNPRDIPGDFLRIRIADTGEGMSKEAREHLFEPFFTTKQQGKGTGLGLASVYGLIKTLRGAIDVESQEKKGTCITIIVPVIRKKIRKTKPRRAQSVLPVKKGVILLVDDERTVRESTSILLGRLGYEIVPCSNGVEALKSYDSRREEIDMVILDMIMPGMGGRETFFKLKERNESIKVIGISGYTDHNMDEMLNSGMAKMIIKPFTVQELSSAVDEVFACGRKQRRPDM
ncbi:MAG: ABC transporter substrate binding protein [Chitinispirillaceae bacterium]